jgi:hypothetical protein
MMVRECTSTCYILFLDCGSACMSLFPTLAEYFMYSHLSYFLYIPSLICCLEDEEFFMKTSSRRVAPRSSTCGVVLCSAA